MITKISEVLQAAIDHPDYLSPDSHGDSWLCSIVFRLETENKITNATAEEVTDMISDSLGDYAFLRSFLVNTGVLGDDIKYPDPAYKVATMKYWRALIKKQKEVESE